MIPPCMRHGCHARYTEPPVHLMSEACSEAGTGQPPAGRTIPASGLHTSQMSYISLAFTYPSLHGEMYSEVFHRPFLCPGLAAIIVQVTVSAPLCTPSFSPKFLPWAASNTVMFVSLGSRLSSNVRMYQKSMHRSCSQRRCPLPSSKFACAAPSPKIFFSCLRTGHNSSNSCGYNASEGDASRLEAKNVEAFPVADPQSLRVSPQ